MWKTTKTMTASTCWIGESSLKAFHTRFRILLALCMTCSWREVTRFCWAYGEFVGLRVPVEIRRDHGGLIESLSGEGDGEGDMGKARAFAVEL